MNYRIERYADGKEETIILGQISTAAARSRASRLSQKDTDLGSGVGHSVYLMGADSNGDDQEHYNYFAGSLVEKDLVKDWDK
ncbi:hypothetical protein [Agrobacterium tumefaciens]|uniref:hypothetical protein n=1 Tax=Agrobacterium tumefaciens TaxID=358 RepID=UPI0015731322|nr:hypothetical protein [Agrobacterium tumefaciens]NSX94451.1 hypothetical protein [Agrobacterium tumefaciens]